MSSRDKKAQVGARVPHDVLQRAKDAAAALGLSFNVWVEKSFEATIADSGFTGPASVMEGQTSILEEAIGRGMDVALVVDNTLPPGTIEIRDGDETLVRAERVESPARTPFDRSCSNGTYHWKHGPGNPCRFCGGEI